MSMNLVTILYLIASVCFIQALKGLSHPTTSIRGNLFGMVGMAIAAVTTVGLIWTKPGPGQEPGGRPGLGRAGCPDRRHGYGAYRWPNGSR
jgi:NAD(P) transhydrogenase subunit beta